MLCTSSSIPLVCSLGLVIAVYYRDVSVAGVINCPSQALGCSKHRHCSLHNHIQLPAAVVVSVSPSIQVAYYAPLVCVFVFVCVCVGRDVMIHVSLAFLFRFGSHKCRSKVLLHCTRIYMYIHAHASSHEFHTRDIVSARAMSKL